MIVTPLMLFTGGLTAIGLLFVMLAVAMPQRNILRDRLSADEAEALALGEEWEGLSLRDRLFRPLARIFVGLVGKAVPAAQLQAIDTQLNNLGNPWGLTGSTFVSLLIVAGTAGLALGVVMAILGGLTGTTQIIAPVAGMIMGVMYPRIKLQRLAKKRKQDIGASLADMLDLLTICVEAGLTIDGGLREIAFAYDNALAMEFRRLLNEVNLGRSRDEALAAMAERSGVEELQSLTSAIIQSQKLGSGIGQTLRVQSEEVRRAKRQKAEETAARAPLKMLFPMVGCIFPAIFMVLLGPAGVIIASGSGSK